MQELFAANYELWLVLPFTVISSFANAMALKPSRGKHVLLALLALVMAGEAGLLMWGISVRSAKAAAASTKRAPPRDEPTPVSKPSPKVRDDKSNGSEEAAAVGGVSFSLSSRTNPEIRRAFCIDGELNGKFYTYADTLRVRLDTADFDLCKYSSDNQREVEYFVGVGRHTDIASMNWRAIAWSKPQRGSVTAGQDYVSHLAPTEPLSIPLNRSLKIKLSTNLSEYGAVVKVYNRARRGQYYLSENLK